MKKLIMINGTMGVGKTATSQALKKLLAKSVFLDGDWCWEMSPFIVNEETKAMVLDNITHLLNNFLRCSEFEHVIFCWVMHQQSIMDEILLRLNLDGCELYLFTLICSEQVLIDRVKADIDRGVRSADVIGLTLSRLLNYEAMSTTKIDVSNIQAGQAAEIIAAALGT